MRHRLVVMTSTWLVIAGRAAVWWSAPKNPTPAALWAVGVRVQPLPRASPQVHAAAAEQAAHHVFPHLPRTTRMAAELVRFAAPHVPRLAHPQTAWIVTWNHRSLPRGYRRALFPIRPFTHMNVVVGAKTGAVLLAFASD